MLAIPWTKQRLAPVPHRSIDDMPLQLHGRNEENVPIFSGAMEGNSTAPWLFTIGVGVLLAAVFLVAGVHALANHGGVYRFFAALIVAGFVSGTIVAGAVWWYRITREIPHLASIEDLAVRFELEAEAVRLMASREGIRPRAEVNGKHLYRPRDFGHDTG